MAIKLYTTRVLLEILGIADYGVWNLVYGTVIAFTFISSPLTTATQRFLNYDQGVKSENQVVIFTSSVVYVIIVSVLLVVIMETGGLWFVNNELVYPEAATESVKFIYQCCVVILLVGLIKLPFEALIVSNEKFSFYAWISIIDATIQLINILLLKFIHIGHPLKLYGILMLIGSCITLSCYILYSRRKFLPANIDWHIDKRFFREISKFSGWNLFGSISSMTANQGLNVLLNIFFGSIVNAAYGVSMQVRGAFALLADNLVKAANPRIVKLYAQGKIDEMMSLVKNISTLSFLLIFSLSFIVGVYIKLIMHTWIGSNIPQYADIFSVLAIIQVLVLCLAAPVDTVIFATGKIKNYQISLSSVILLNLLVSYYLLKLGFTPPTVLYVKCAVEFVVLVVRIWFVHIMVGYSIVKYFLNMILPAIGILLISVGYRWSYEQIVGIKETYGNLVVFGVSYMALMGFVVLLYKPKIRGRIISKIVRKS